MGGEVLELMRERAERLEREAEARGLERGLERGLKRGMTQGVEALANKLREQGVDEAIIRSSIEALTAEDTTPSG